MDKIKEILDDLNIDEEVLAIYPYGSKVYGTADEFSDTDYIIVTKGAMLKSGAFKQNAISNRTRTLQGVLYSRSGFQDAINNYDISALECLSLPEDKVILSKWPFKVNRWYDKEMVKKIITKASNSWFIADQQAIDGFRDRAKKGVFHAIRILNFGLQLKEHRKIVDYSCCNELWETFKYIPDEEFDTRNYIFIRDQLMDELRK